MADDHDVAVAVGRSHIIERPRLTRLLDEASSRVILLVAPAGYGKTTLARQWLEKRPHAWYRGTLASADVAALAMGIAEVASSIVPGAGQRLRDRLRASETPAKEVEILAELLAEDLASWPPDAWIAVDDYQYLASAPETEAFLENLIDRSAARFLLGARERPSWVTARSLVYAEVFELGRSSLAMSRDEAAEILTRRPSEEVSGLFALAEGWPAVLGLVAVGEFDLPDRSVSGALYDFFAEELFQPLPTDVQSNLARLAFAPVVTGRLASVLFGEDAPSVLGDAIRLGVLTPHSPGTYDLHPLLRDFLRRKLLFTLPNDVRSATLREVTTFLIDERRWDEVFALIEEFSTPEALIVLVEHAMLPLLEEGRLSTLERWLAFANQNGIRSPLLDLAEAEILFRAGAHQQAQALALQARRRLDAAELVSRALALAGESAYQLDQSEVSLRLAEEALEHAAAPSVRRRATWGRFLAAIQLESERAQALLADVEQAFGDSVDGALRLASGRLLLAATSERMEDAVNSVRPVVHLVDRSRDPKARTSFLHVFASALAATAYYGEALEMVERGKREAEHFRLGFTLPFALVVETNARVGLRDFNVAAALLEQCSRLAAETTDVFLDMSARITRAKLLIAHGMFDEAAAITLKTWAHTPGPVVYGELLGVRALAQACAHQVDEALQTAAEATELTHGVEARTLAACAQAIVSLADVRVNGDATDAFNVAETTQNYDGLVVALRGSRPFLKIGARLPARRAYLTEVLTRSHDRELARAIGVPYLQTTDAPDYDLSPRERDVFDLLLQGQTNKEIAAELYLSEATIKLHVRHILRKLGVRSRTEAVLKGLPSRS